MDAVALVVYAVSALPSLTGVPAHEWIGLIVSVVFIAHIAVHVDWAIRVLRGLGGGKWAQAGKLALSALLLVAFVTCAVSGAMVSGTVLPAMGLYAPGYYFWDPLHAVSAKVLLALLLVHVVVHGKWIASALKGAKGSSSEKGASSK